MWRSRADPQSARRVWQEGRGRPRSTPRDRQGEQVRGREGGAKGKGVPVHEVDPGEPANLRGNRRDRPKPSGAARPRSKP